MRNFTLPQKSNSIFLIFLFGILSSTIQLNYLKTAAFVFSGNEISISIILGHWLIFTATGSYFGGKFHNRTHLVSVASVYSILSIIFYWLIFLSRRIFHIENFITISIEKIFFLSFVFMSVPVFLNGFLFPILTKELQQQNKHQIINKIYGLELLGAASGSLLFAIILFFSGNTYYLLLALNLLFLSYLFLCKRHYNSIIIILILSITLMFFESKIKNQFYTNFELESLVETPIGTISSLENNNSIFSDNIFIYDSESFEHSEEMVHFYCSAHKSPEKILILGNITPLIYNELLKYKTIKNITSIIENRRLFQIIWKDKIFPANTQCIFGDPYKILKNLKDKFDVIIFNIPSPSNFKWNRYYTSEFFQQLNHLTKNESVVGISLKGSETFLPEAQVEFLKTIQNTLEINFRTITIIPGETIHFICSEEKIDSISIKPENNIYVIPETLSDRLSTFKTNFLNDKLNQSKTNRTNSLFRPVGIYYSTILSQQLTKSILAKAYIFLRKIGIKYIFIGSFLGSLLLLIKNNQDQIIKRKMLFFGFFVMSIESILILLNQSISGAIYLQTALIIFIFMFGAGLSSYFYNKFQLTEKWIFVACNLITLFSIMTIFFNQLAIFIYIIIFGTGVISGQIFPRLINSWNGVNSGELISKTGSLYALEVLGGSIGLYVISIFVIPVWGFLAALGILQIFVVIFTINIFLQNRGS